MTDTVIGVGMVVLGLGWLVLAVAWYYLRERRKGGFPHTRRFYR